MQHQHGGDDRYHGHKVNIHAAFYRAQPLDGECPSHKAQGRSPQPQKQQVSGVGEICQPLWLPRNIHKGQCWQHEQQTVKKAAPRNQQAVVTKGHDLAGEDGISRPRKPRQHGQHIAHGVKPQLRAAAEADEANAQHGRHKAQKKVQAGALCPQQPKGQQARKKWRDRHNHTHI